MSRAEFHQLFRALAQHDRATAEHSARVRRYALWVAEDLGLSQERRQQLSLAALLHDVGKTFLPGALLNKPGRLTPEEYCRVQEHPAVGERMLHALLAPPEVLAAIRWHHERPDGTGYPDRLRSDQIPLLAQVLAVADSFDAMTTVRPYRKAMNWVEALDCLRGGKGSQFDPEVVERFARALQFGVEDVYLPAVAGCLGGRR